MSSVQLRDAPLRVLPVHRPWRSLGGRGSGHLIKRHARAYRHMGLGFVSGIGEPLCYPPSIGGGVRGPGGNATGAGGPPRGDAALVAPALLATTSMTGAIYDATFNVYLRLKYAKLYDAVLATPMRAGDVALGEIGWALTRGSMYAAAFLGVMLVLGLLHSPWA